MSGLTSFFARGGAHSLAVWPELLRQIAVNSLCGPPLIAGVASLVARLDDESGRRVLRLEPRRLGP
jgi:hypothetical protein